MIPNRPSQATLLGHRDAARRLRAEWLMLVHVGAMGIGDVISEACRPESSALQKLTLMQLLMAQEGVGEFRARHTIEHVQSVAKSCTMEPRQVTIGWLLDNRAGGRRYAAWVDALQPKDGPPVSGFPYAPIERNAHVGQ